MAKLRIVLDTNLLVSGIFWGGLPHEILKLWFEGRFEVWATEEIVTEYFRIIEKIAKGNLRLIQEWKLLLAESLKICSTNVIITLCRDPKDDMFLECAASISAKYIVSGDKDLLVLKSFGKATIVTAHEFVDSINR